MAYRTDETSLMPGLFDRATVGTTQQIQDFMNEFIGKILEDTDPRLRILWDIPRRDLGTTFSRRFEIRRNSRILAFGVVSAGGDVERMRTEEARRLNEEVLVPENRRAGYISVTTKADQGGLKVQFATVSLTLDGVTEAEPALVDWELSTVDLDYREPAECAETLFRTFLNMCIAENSSTAGITDLDGWGFEGDTI